jgi:K+-sensing histidine kinase KdpD
MMSSVTRTVSAAERLRAYALSLPAVGAGLWAGILIARTDAHLLAATPLALAVALSAWYGGLGPGLFALATAVLSIEVFLFERGALFNSISMAQGVALTAFIIGWTVFSYLSGIGVRRSERDRQARLDAELASSQASRLSQLTSALSQARTTRAVIEAAVQECLHAMHADAGALLMISRDGARAEVARVVGYADGLAPVTTAGRSWSSSRAPRARPNTRGRSAAAAAIRSKRLPSCRSSSAAASSPSCNSSSRSRGL